MGWQARDHNMIGGSSIVLLQERFKQLQRAREQREKKELQLFSDPPQYMAPVLKQRMVSSLGEFDQEPLSLGLTLCTNNTELQDFNKQEILRSTKGTTLNTLDMIENYGVDTSLHL